MERTRFLKSTPKPPAKQASRTCREHLHPARLNALKQPDVWMFEPHRPFGAARSVLPADCVLT
jgi:hypothetical protein